MKKLRIEVWVQMATGIAVIIGIALLIYELQLVRQIAFTEMAQEAMTEISLRETTIFGENAATTLAKACLSPQELSDTDKVVLDSVFSTQLQFAIRIKLLEDTGDNATPWRRNTQQAVDYITSFPQGESWMEFGKNFWDSEFNQAVVNALAARSDLTCQDRMALMDNH